MENSSVSSAVLTKEVTDPSFDPRVKILKDFLSKQESPLAPFAQNFIEDADAYNLDWKMVAAISGVESTFGQNIPAGSYNAWGWGVYGNNVTRFSSWKEGIETISKSLREDYMNKWGTTNVYEIGRMYAASPAWAYHVAFYMNRIEEFKLANPETSLPITL